MTCRASSFGTYLRDKRVAAGLSLRDVARLMGITAVYFGEVERGVRGPFVRERWVDLAASIPGVTLDELERHAQLSAGLRLDLSDAPPEYQDLGLALARRIERRDLKPVAIRSILRLLDAPCALRRQPPRGAISLWKYITNRSTVPPSRHGWYGRPARGAGVPDERGIHVKAKRHRVVG